MEGVRVMSYTPGPWKAERWEYGDKSGWSVRPCNGEFVTGYQIVYMRNNGAEHTMVGLRGGTIEGTVKLIAAAPQLVEVCKRAIKYFGCLNVYPFKQTCIEAKSVGDAVCWRCEMEIAINKAEVGDKVVCGG